MTEREWLSQLKIGDEVVIQGSGGVGPTDSISTIVRTTKTLLFTESGKKFRITDGRSPGSGYLRTFLVEPTQERTDEIKRANLVLRLGRVDWKTLPLETLREVYKLVSKST